MSTYIVIREKQAYTTRKMMGCTEIEWGQSIGMASVFMPEK